MTAPALVKAAHLFLIEEGNRPKRPKLSVPEQAELRTDLHTIEAHSVPFAEPTVLARRGDLAARLFGYDDSFDEVAANVIADVLHAVSAHGYDPMTVLAHARAYYYREAPVFDMERTG